MTSTTDLTRNIHPAYLFFTGVCMGAADVVPGVSGGTMAFVLGIYPQLLASIQAFNLSLLQDIGRFRLKDAWQKIPWRFLLPLGLGIVVAVATLAELLSYLLAHHKEFLFAFFFGLVVASILALAFRLTWTIASGCAFLIGAGFAYWLVGLVPADPGHSPLILFGSLAVAICAMILPGISGSFILLILGQYAYCVNALTTFIDALKAFDLATIGKTTLEVILPAGLGAVTGLLTFSRLLSWLLKRYYTITVAVLIGFMAGSLRRIWPYKEILTTRVDRHGDEVPLEWKNVLPDALDGSVLAAILLAIAGFVVLSVIDHIYDRNNPFIKRIGTLAGRN